MHNFVLRKITPMHSATTICLSDAAGCINCVLGGIAQLGERLHGMQEVSGSIPLTSTSEDLLVKSGSPSSRGLGHHPFTVGTGVRIP